MRVVYVSPLKALSADIHKNLAEPRRGIRRIAEEMGLEPPRITAAVRTGDTPQAERAAMLRTPPHILVTTPESLYLLLTAERSREMLRTVAHRHRRRDPRRDRHAPRRASRAHPRAAGAGRRAAAAAHRPVGDAEAGRGGRPFLVGTAAVDASDAPRAPSSTKGIGATMDLGARDARGRRSKR